MTKRKRRGDILPLSLPPIGLSRDVASAYIDVSPSKFDQMVSDGRMPRPRKIDARRVWYRPEVEAAFVALPVDGEEVREEWDWTPTPMTPEEQASRSLTSWERRLLFSLYRAGGRAEPSTIEGSGPASRESLAERGLLVDSGNSLQITASGRAMAETGGVKTAKEVVTTPVNTGPRAPKARGPNANPTLDSDLIPYRFAVGHSDKKLTSKLGLSELKVLRQLHPLDGRKNSRFDILGAGQSICGLLYARGYIEELGRGGGTWLAITAAGKAAFEATL